MGQPVDRTPELEGRVLLVDDEDIVLSVGTRMLERLGCQVWSARSGAEALDMVVHASDPFSCVVVDLTMPEMDGRELLDKLHQIQPELPVVLASGFSESDLSTDFGDDGFAGFLQKPFRLAELAAKLGAILQRSA